MAKQPHRSQSLRGQLLADAFEREKLKQATKAATKENDGIDENEVEE
jgi:hypothetical protein